MNRRSFLTSLIGGVAASAAVRTWPFRVYSFPSTYKLYEPIYLVPPTLPEFIAQYSNELAELLTGTYPALAGYPRSELDLRPTAEVVHPLFCRIVYPMRLLA
jgi:hypothetical protein